MRYDYKILTYNINRLPDKVNQLLEQGYSLVGGVAYDSHSGDLIQALVKEINELEQ